MGILTILFTGILVVATGIYLYFKWRYTFFEKEGVPHLKPTFPFGNFQGIGSKYHFSDILMSLYNDLKGKGQIAGFYNLAEPTYIVTDIELIKHITVKNFNSFVNRGFYYNEKDEPLSAHLVAIEDDRWRFLRNKLSPALTSGKLRSMYSIFNDMGNNLVKAIEKKSKNGNGMETKEMMTRFTIDVVSSTTFGMDANTLKGEHDELYLISREVFGSEGPSALYLFFLFAFPDLSRFLGLKQFSNRVSDFFMNIVSTNIKYREDNNVNRSDFLNMLIQLKNKGSIDGEISSESKKLTLNEVLAQAFIFFLGGTDTSSTTLSFALTELAYNLDVQQKLRQEIIKSTKDSNGEVSYEMLNEMTYLNKVVNETLRMYTPGFALMRAANEDFKVPNSEITIRKGYKLWIPTLGFHYDEKYWPNPKKFDPERFTHEEIAKRPTQCFFPFGEGPRNCIGMRFALLNVKYAIVTVIKNFKLTPDPRMKYPIQIDPKSLQFEPKDGYLLKFEKI